ncbi:MAG TPA: FxsA family protein [Solirubrobacteraceae bacterium]|nr:FxsA family protein [Solirubrobacteraceae bacterium]
MFVFIPLIVLIAAEVLAFTEVGHAIGWLPAVVLLLGTSVIGVQLLRIQGRAAIERVSLAVSERRAPGRAALDGALGFIGGVLLVVPGFVTDALGALLIFRPTRALARRWISHHYAGRVMSFAAATGRFAPRGRSSRPADVDSTAVDDDLDQLAR